MSNFFVVGRDILSSDFAKGGPTQRDIIPWLDVQRDVFETLG